MSSAADATAIFYQHLQASRLLTDAQLRDLWGWIAHARPDLPAAAREVSRRGWLTPYQIREVARGRGSALKVASRYVLLAVLGEGGMGRVYKAHDTRMGRDVALKVIRRERLTHSVAVVRFEQEVLALSAMDHPNVVKVYDAEEVDGYHFYVMELIDGTDLTKIVREAGPLPIARACDVIRQAALGLQHAHERGLVHRDIKPSNIIAPRHGGAVKLVDLGLARLMEPPGGPDAHRITQEGFVIGTPDFVAPEQARNPTAVDIRADIYALGGTLYFALTGLVPYDGATPTEKLLKHCIDPPPDLLSRRPDAPAALEQIIHWCMAKEPDHRPQTPLQLAAALQPFCPALAPGSEALMAPAFGHQDPAARPGGHPATTPAPDPAPDPFSTADPGPGGQAFTLSAREDGPALRRRPRATFPVGPVLVVLGGLFVLAALGAAVLLAFMNAGPAVPEPFTNTAGMKMVRLDGGAFKMGSPEEEPGRADDGREGPVREVTVRGPFFMSATEVTHGQYVRMMGGAPSRGASLAARGTSLPVDSVTWDEANEFCRKLLEKDRGQPWARNGWAYRLPTEAEWEYACRANTTTPFSCGDTVAFPKQAVFLATGEDALEGVGEVPGKPLRFGTEVGKTKPNDFGLYDMHGNVAEWCGDWFRIDAYKDGARADPTGPADGDMRVIRGGSFRDRAPGVRSAARDGKRPTDRFDYVGFRVVYAPLQK
ncbi:bifunctional serine/threonine-protein kinase/formylglycine-generating enzyme family protein [Gemmata sp. JC717]|uniref:bifunctional serine/threonine-protein kinase/formylglycine-generating enzyme family protein n=1 Tax=Gemmata algarum TaxID=2975278 RepID=UPI0021BAE4F9|nr:bifunctional serine/threonine-protein kinase/formylglycine-generating enzyme family protein [Gemmata algarum]MDY3551592.1 bifunctional serine/threonine-protein kinase/formylglycine-generating enzyme family protein [Gemmata algarum]